MAKQIISRPGANASAGRNTSFASSSNVVQLFDAHAPRHTPKRRHTRSSGSVLRFTGAKRYNFDREAVLTKWQQDMEAAAMKLYLDVARGKVTGLMIFSSSGAPGEGESDTELGVAGIFVEDAGWASERAEFAARVLRDAAAGSTGDFE